MCDIGHSMTTGGISGGNGVGFKKQQAEDGEGDGGMIDGGGEGSTVETETGQALRDK